MLATRAELSVKAKQLVPSPLTSVAHGGRNSMQAAESGGQSKLTNSSESLWCLELLEESCFWSPISKLFPLPPIKNGTRIRRRPTSFAINSRTKSAKRSEVTLRLSTEMQKSRVRLTRSRAFLLLLPERS